MARKTGIELDGPFFQRDPAKTFRRNIRDFMDEVVRLGEEETRRELQAGEHRRRPISAGVEPARVSAHVVGRTKSLSGRRWAVTGVVSVNNSRLSAKQGIALMAAASEIEGRDHVFRKVTSRLRRARVELLKGLV